MNFIETPLQVRGSTRELHILRAARERYSIAESLFGIRGRVLFSDVDAARHLADRMNEAREARRYPELAVRAGELYAAGLIHEVNHLVIEAVRRRSRPDPIRVAMAKAAEELGRDSLDGLMARFVDLFPNSQVARGRVTVSEYLSGETAGTPNDEVAYEELLLLRLANLNPAAERFRELFDDGPLQEGNGYERLIEGARTSTGLAVEGEAGASADRSLFELLEAPMRSSPTSLEGQLVYIRSNWQPLLGKQLDQLLDRLLLGMDLLAEERKPGFAGPPADQPAPTAEDLLGPGGRVEYERFSPDAAWMPRLVLLAKSTYVWLDQLSRRYGREIRQLDAIPDEELDEIAERGFTGLWLIGLWERSEASRRIKHLRGQPDAVASAYALHDYRISEDLGGESAFQDLRARAWERGIRLASDMVPNHMGIDSRWVIEHPDWFVQLDRSPFPGYSFDGPDLSSNEQVGVYLEDHYFDNSDAAVVFKRVDRGSGQERFIYHGNDGTSMPWNDTAQLDYLKPEVREAVIATIIDVARRFPIIRFDAAMTLAKQHIQRLWYPEPGHGGAIPSRSQLGSMSAQEFERAIPEEFWREVVDRVAREVPDTLLLAEAFWMMEGYFVRTLGMHRVYNSAFMNMLKREANGEFRQLLKNVLDLDPQVLGRFVNFMNNPDEDTAVAQFGKGDKYFGVCTVLSTMPGLPMFGHGQVEGLEEKYGMEFRRARQEESPDPWLVDRHQREIFPLLHRRRQFAGVEGFLLYDFHREDGGVNEDVLAYSNLVDGQASLVLYHNRYAETSGRVHMSAAYSASEEGGRSSRERTLFEGLGLSGGPDIFLLFRDHSSGLEHLAPAAEVRERGLEASLEAYQYRVLLDFRELKNSSEEPYAELCRELSGRGVPSVLDAVHDLRLRPLFDIFGDLLDTPIHETEAVTSGYRDFLDVLDKFGYRWEERNRGEAEEAFAELVAAWEAHERSPAELDGLAQLETALLAWMALAPLEPASYGRFRLEQEIASGQHSPVEPFEANLYAEVVPLLLEHAPIGAQPYSVRELLARLLDDSRASTFLRTNVYEGEEFFNAEAFRLLSQGVLVAVSLLQLAVEGVSEGLPDRLAELRRIEEASGYRLERLRKAATLKSGRRKARPAGGRSDG